MRDNLHVKVNNKNVGTISYESGEYLFNYIEKESSFISLTMPFRKKSYTNDKLHPIFEMHLPEGYLLSIIKKHFSKITKTDDFGLLKLMSNSIKGRVSYDANKEEDESLDLDTLLHPQRENLFEELVSKFALKSPLSGVQPKVLAKVKEKVTLPLQEYIVKSWGEDYPQLTLNEYYCMKIVKETGLCVPDFYLSDDNKLFIMKRFDITDDEKYLGFEDMCVLQAKQSEDKYEGSYEQVAKTIKTFVSPKNRKKALSDFFQMMVINKLVQNGDAHLKNFGLIYEDINDIKLAPTYDVVCTTIYIKNDIPALFLLGSKKWWKKELLIRFAKESCDLTTKEANTLYEKCIDSLSKIIVDIKKRISTEQDPYVKEFLEKLLTKLSLNI